MDLRRSDADEIRKLHEKFFPGKDLWVGDDHAFWVVIDRGRPVGFCSAKIDRYKSVFLSRSGVLRSYRKAGLHRRMIAVRLAWARRHGAKRAWTYTLYSNYPVITNLLRAGFRFTHSSDRRRFHYFKLRLR